MTAVHRVAVLVFDGVKLLDVAGPSEVVAEVTSQIPVPSTRCWSWVATCSRRCR